MSLKIRSKRALQSVCLTYLMAIEDETSLNYCLNLVEKSDGMSNKVTGLNLLAHHDGPLHEKAMDSFLKQWEKDPLIMNKWFLAQALSRRDDVVASITKLLDHPSFDIKNPNKAYSLIYAFAQNNIKHFHNSDGSGYQFLADNVLKINDFNPQVAARIMSPLCRWKQFDDKRQVLMKAELTRILAYDKLSDDVKEIATKGLTA